LNHLVLLTASELSLGGSSPYTSTDETNENTHERNNTKKTQYKQYKTQYIQVYICTYRLYLRHCYIFLTKYDTCVHSLMMAMCISRNMLE